MSDKRCTKCEQHLSVENFAYKNKLTGKLSSWCKSCMAKHNNQKYHSDASRRKYIRDNEKRLVERNVSFIEELLAQSSCVDCGETDRRVLEFDHKDSIAKVHNVSHMVLKAWSLEKLKAEIAKCDVCCANCHRRRSWTRGRWREKYQIAPRARWEGSGFTRRH